MKKPADATINWREFSGLLVSAVAALAVPATSARMIEPARESGQPFVRPGMLQTREDLERIRLAVRDRREPIFSGFEKLRSDPLSQLSYRSKAEIGRNPNVRFRDFDSDSNAAYQCAVMWRITQKQAYTDLAISIVDGWSAELRTISGADAVLCAALGGFKIANAAELLRHSDSGWSPEHAERLNDMLRNVFLPVIVNFAAFANRNWDTAAMKMMMAIACSAKPAIV